MPIPPVNKIIDLDFSDPSCFNGTGLSINDLSSSNNDFTISNSSYVYSTIFGGELYLNSPNLNTFMYRDGITNYSYGTSAFSVHLWFQLNQKNALDLTQFFCVNFTGGAGSNNNPFVGCLSGNALFATDGTVTNNYSQTINLNEWYLLSFVKPSGGSMNDVQMYINGTLVSFTGGGSTPVNVSNPSSRMGISTTATSTPVWNAAITVGRYVFYNTAITGTDVTDFYNSTRNRFYKKLEYDFQNGSYPGSGTSIFDLSGNGITANIVAGGTYVSGFPNYIDLQGNTNILATNANIPTNTSLTINAWVQPSFQYPSSGYGNWWSTGNDGNGTIPFLGLSNVGGTNVIVSGGFGAGTTQSFNSANFDPSKWYYYSVVSSSATGTSLFVNGSLVGTNAGWIRPQVGNFRIGTYDDPTSATKGYGKLAYVDFYNVALTSSEILANYNASSAPYDNLVALYDFQDPASYPGSGSTVYDLSGTGNTLAITSGGAFVSGTPNYINLNNNTAIYKSPALGGVANTNVYTLNAWYYLPSAPGNSVVYEIGKDLSNQAAQVGTGFGLGTLYGSGGFGVGVLEFTGAVPNAWNFLSYVSTGTATTVYLNGVNVGTSANVPSIPADGGIVIGTALNSSSPPAPRLDLCAKGRIGFYSIYKSALTQAEIATIYNDTYAPYVPAPPAYQGIVGGRQFNQGFNG